MTEPHDRQQQDWIARLAAAVAERSCPAAGSSDGGADDATVVPAVAAPLPAWPWAISGLGLCLAVLALGPLSDDRPFVAGEPMPQPQVQGWRSYELPATRWPLDIPATGYHGIERAPFDEPPLAAAEAVAVVSPPAPELPPLPAIELPVAMPQVVQDLVTALAPVEEVTVMEQVPAPPPPATTVVPTAAPDAAVGTIAAPAPPPTKAAAASTEIAERPSAASRRPPPAAKRGAATRRAKGEPAASGSDDLEWRDQLFGRRRG